MPIIIYATKSGQFRYKITGKNNETLVFSESMKTRQAIKRGIVALQKQMGREKIVLDVIDKTGIGKEIKFV